jgi:hypothetical protein
VPTPLHEYGKELPRKLPNAGANASFGSIAPLQHLDNVEVAFRLVPTEVELNGMFLASNRGPFVPAANGKPRRYISCH